MATIESKEAEAARAQSLFREVNERVRELVETDPSEFLCECIRRECVETIEMTLAEYERIRLVPTHFIVIPGHIDADIERVVGTTDAYQVVEKIGEGEATAVRLDPRRRASAKQ